MTVHVHVHLEGGRLVTVRTLDSGTIRTILASGNEIWAAGSGVYQWDGSAFVEAPLVESKGIKIVRTLNLEPERKTKLLAERNLPRGTIDVAHFSAGDAFELNEQDILEKLDASRIPNLANVRAGLATPYFVPDDLTRDARNESFSTGKNALQRAICAVIARNIRSYFRQEGRNELSNCNVMLLYERAE